MRPVSRTLIFSMVVGLLAGCVSFDAAGYRTFVVDPAPLATTWGGLPLETGQIIVTEHPGATSLFLSLTARDYHPFLHIGIIVIEADRPFVYEAMGATLPLPWARPNAHVGGGVQRVALNGFLERGGIIAIYEPPASVDRRTLAEFARARWREKFPFDALYDASDPSKYYCVEFVVRALEAAGAAAMRATPITLNPSMQVALKWLDIRSPELLMAGAVIAHERRVALINRGLSESQIERYFLLKRELHRRFTLDQRLGNVMFWRRQQLRLRPRVEEFFEFGILEQTDPKLLADRIFGTLRARVATVTP